MVKQRTLKNSIRAMGVGVHTGEKVFLTVKPADPNTGILFKRIDLDPMVEIPARSEFVGDTRLSTKLARGDVSIFTVEHLLSAMSGLGIDNAIVELTSSELPIMDGSSGPFVFLLQSAGIQAQNAPKKFIKINEEISVEHGDAYAKVSPYTGFCVSYEMDYSHPMLSQQDKKIAKLDFSTVSYVKEISRARTFGFMADYEMLQANNLALGASLDNTVVLDDFRVINEDGTRYHNEMVRHKILDAIGDLYLLGYGMVGAFTGVKSGHTLNNRLVKEILANEQAWELITCEEEDCVIRYADPLVTLAT